MIKAIFSDINGVLFAQNESWSLRYSRDFNIDISLLLNMFESDDMYKCLTGKADFKNCIKKYLSTWKWNESEDKLLEYWLNEADIPHKKFIKILQTLQAKGIKLFYATQNDYYRTRKFINKLKMFINFDYEIATYQIGYKKNEIEYYINSLKKYNLLPNEVLFIDNNKKAIDVAKKLGIQTYFFTTEEKAIQYLYTKKGLLK